MAGPTSGVGPLRSLFRVPVPALELRSLTKRYDDGFLALDGFDLIVAQLLHLESSDPDKDISIYINSPGGSIYAGLAIYDTMQFIKPDVQTICCGIAMSMGSLLLAGGAAGKRFSLPNSRILIHQPSAGFEGQSSDIEIHMREILKTRDRIDEIYAKHTGQTVEQVHSDMERDRFFKPDEAAEYGLIDRVISSH